MPDVTAATAHAAAGPRSAGPGGGSVAQARGVAVSDYLRDILMEYYEDREDEQRAEARLAERQPSISSSQLRKNLGLDG